MKPTVVMKVEEATCTMVRPTQERVQENVKTAIKALRQRDAYLLQKDVNERSISHKLASYLQDAFTDWDVDCEYNRDHDDPKLLKRLQIHAEKVSPDDMHARTVFPDIVVHHRGTGDNLLVIEIKKKTNQQPDCFDEQKLSEFKCQLGYSYALFLRFQTDGEVIGVKTEKWI